MTSPTLAEKVVGVHRALDAGGVAHAFGGALALAYLTEEVRATKDIDVNVFVTVGEVDRVLIALPSEVTRTSEDAGAVRRDAQVRLWWDHTPLDLFFDVDDIHREAALHARWVPFADTEIPVLDGTELTVFKMMFARPKDWVDIQEMLHAGTVDVPAVETAFARIVDRDHEVLVRRRELADATDEA